MTRTTTKIYTPPRISIISLFTKNKNTKKNSFTYSIFYVMNHFSLISGRLFGQKMQENLIPKWRCDKRNNFENGWQLSDWIDSTITHTFDGMALKSLKSDGLVLVSDSRGTQMKQKMLKGSGFWHVLKKK